MKFIKSLTIVFLCCSTISSLQAQWGATTGSLTFQTAPHNDVLVGGVSILGSGSKCFWDFGKKAFRGGFLTSGNNYWNLDSLGTYSFSYGKDTKAYGDSSFSVGENAEAIKDNSIAIGRFTKASGLRSVAFGTSCTASGIDAISMGRKMEAGGFGSFTNRKRKHRRQHLPRSKTSSQWRYRDRDHHSEYIRNHPLYRLSISRTYRNKLEKFGWTISVGWIR